MEIPKFKLNHIIIAVLLLCSYVADAQSYIRVTGRVIDSQNENAIGFAHVGIPELGIGTTSGNDGVFSLKIPAKGKNSKMTISFLGYQTYQINVMDINDHLKVKLQRSATDLTEIVVTDKNQPIDIVRKAIKNISNNYPTKSMTHLGFYRESRTDDSLRHKYLAEGVLKIYTKSYKKKKNGGLIGLVQGRLMNFKNPLDTVSNAGLTSGHMAAHRFDFVKNREDFIDKKLLDLYQYELEEITTYQDRPVYIISFGPDLSKVKPQEKNENKTNFLQAIAAAIMKKKVPETHARLKGRMFIDADSYAFIRAEFEVTKSGLKKKNDYPLYAGTWRYNKYVVNYRKHNEKWYFSDALREGGYRGEGVYTNEIKITQIDTGDQGPIPYEERISRGDEFAQETGSYEDSFWKSFNTTPLKAALAESVQQFKNIKKSSEVFSPKRMAALKALRDSVDLANRTVVSIDEDGNEQEIILEPGLSNEKENNYKVRTMIGIGTHLISTSPNNLFVKYDDDNGAEILSLNNGFKGRDFEIISSFDMDFPINKNLFIRGGYTFEFANSIYKELSVGLGYQLKLTKEGRPFYLRGVTGVDRLRYARKIGQAKNEYGKFKVGKKKFKAENINLYYGSRTFNLKLSGELAMEFDGSPQMYLRGTYYLPFSQRQDLWFFERKKIGRKKRYVPVDDERVSVLRNDISFNESIISEGSFSILFGISF